VPRSVWGNRLGAHCKRWHEWTLADPVARSWGRRTRRERWVSLCQVPRL